MNKNKEVKKVVRIKGKEVPKELLEIVIKRIQAMPPNIKLAVLGKLLTREDIIKAITEMSPIGEEILEVEMDYYLHLIKD